MRVAVFVICLVALGVIGVVAVYAGVCDGNVTDCIGWGPSGGASPNPYPGYCCTHGALRGFTSIADANGMCNDINRGGFCGDLRSETWDPISQKWSCSDLISYSSCGDPLGTVGAGICTPGDCSY